MKSSIVIYIRAPKSPHVCKEREVGRLRAELSGDRQASLLALERQWEAKLSEQRDTLEKRLTAAERAAEARAAEAERARAADAARFEALTARAAREAEAAARVLKVKAN